MATSIAITAAEPNGLWGLLKQSFAVGTQLAKAKMDPTTDALINALVNDFGTAEGRSVTRDGLKDKLKGSKFAEIKDKFVEIRRQAAAVVDAKAPSDATAIKGWLHQISQHVAEGRHRGWISGHRRRGGERSREGDADGDLARSRYRQHEAVLMFAKIGQAYEGGQHEKTAHHAHSRWMRTS
jgi:hypothetical protein